MLRAVTAFVGGTVTFVGDRKDQFVQGTPERKDLPAYTRTDLRAGARYEDWTARLYVNNALNRRGLISGDAQALFPFNFYYIQPRMIGLSVSRSF